MADPSRPGSGGTEKYRRKRQITRRDVLRRSAVGGAAVTGTLLWTRPVIDTLLASDVAAATGSPRPCVGTQYAVKIEKKNDTDCGVKVPGEFICEDLAAGARANCPTPVAGTSKGGCAFIQSVDFGDPSGVEGCEKEPWKIVLTDPDAYLILGYSKCTPDQCIEHGSSSGNNTFYFSPCPMNGGFFGVSHVEFAFCIPSD